ncbi:MAG: hypothetical protein H0W33_08670 [Gammaproteobacteria bacterium]|nr:hypothetical protein [Gammaproteobacteria bacterium]
MRCPQIGVLLVLLSAALQAKAGVFDSPWRDGMDRERFMEEVTVIALAPAAFPERIGDEQAAQRFERLLAEALTEAGLNTVASDVYHRLWQDKAVEIGGYYDTRDGSVIEDKHATVQQHTLSSLQAGHDVDAVLYSKVEIVEAPFIQSVAKWDFVRERITGNVSAREHRGSDGWVGKLPALTLLVEIRKLDQGVVYEGRGGIELASRYRMDEFRTVPLDELLKAPEKDGLAVHLGTRWITMEGRALRADIMIKSKMRARK